MIQLADTQATQAFGQQLADALLTLDRGLVITLAGELGAGKTALARATVVALGYRGVVASPTYTLLESYAVAGRHMHHLDLYRLADPEELEFIGLRDLDWTHDWFMIEWPGNGVGHIPPVDMAITLYHADHARTVAIEGLSRIGQRLTQKLDSRR